MTLSGWTNTHYYQVTKTSIGYRWFVYSTALNTRVPYVPRLDRLIRDGWAWTEEQGARRAIDAIHHPRQRTHLPRPVDLHHHRRPR